MAKKLPQNIIDDLNRNSMFNIFGLINLSALKARTNPKMSDKELKRLIQDHFGKEMVTGKVEFM
jgi:hypothetical protein